MNRYPLSRVIIPAAGIIYVIVGILAHRGMVWVIGALVLGLIAVVSTAMNRG